MGYPLDHPPALPVRSFTVTRSIARGFYSATYIAEGQFGQLACLKVIPKKIYELAQKNFWDECRAHAAIANGSQHIVGFQDGFEADVIFPGSSEPLACFVAVLDFIDGQPLGKTFLDETVSARLAAQIAVDLLRLLKELEEKRVFHNDLHDGNLLVERIPLDARRASAIEPSVRVVAVDLGSVLDQSRSDEEATVADNHHVTEHLLRLALGVAPDPIAATDLDFRLRLALTSVAELLRPDNLGQRAPSYADLIATIENAFIAATSPWLKPHEGLTRFADSYNAQTMRPWFVPRLLVDPGGEWRKRIESPGPLVITGMRGCGKTMLLRSLQFHARASNPEDEDRSGAEVLARLRADGYVGLYVSCSRLLDGFGKRSGPLHEPYTRLFLCYAREGLRSLRHLIDLGGREAANPSAPRPIAALIASLVRNSTVEGTEDVHLLERRIQEMLQSLESGEDRYALTSHPATALPSLASAITECADSWAASRVLFLLDDVSTRHLEEEQIRNLISTLMFVNDSCAFKVTTEAQTLELVLKSPGLVETARAGRDYDTFDLAAAIYSKLRAAGGRAGREFVAQVLLQRALMSRSHPVWSPAEVLGDQPLIDIARRIASTADSSPDRKSVYFGLSALAAVCVGDIGDVIAIYERILERAGTIQIVPVAAKTQSAAFQEFCSKRLYQLSRRGGRLKEFADGFSQAAHDLLVQSAQRDPSRIRDYASVYVRVTEGDLDEQLTQLRELMDSGVFVMTDGPDAPRTKTRDSDPIAQYTLTFRKILGLSSAIGLSQRDRFELSGDRLIAWLRSPEKSAELLKENVGIEVPGRSDYHQSVPGADNQKSVLGSVGPRSTLFDFENLLQDEPSAAVQDGDAAPSVSLPTVTPLALGELSALNVSAVVLGLGFEERSLRSIERVTAVVNPNKVIALAYPMNSPFATASSEAMASAQLSVTTMDARRRLQLDVIPRGECLIDATGLTKQRLYDLVRALLLRNGTVLVAYTAPAESYPLEGDVAARFASSAGDDYSRLTMFRGLPTGEQGPFSYVPLHPTVADDGRRRMLLASTSARHERLLSLLEQRDYDHLETLDIAGDNSRSRLALLAARVAGQEVPSSTSRRLDTLSIQETLVAIGESYEHNYSRGNFSFEVGLTGPKLHAVALAAASTALKFSQAWYVHPARLDIDRFTLGAGTTEIYRVTA